MAHAVHDHLKSLGAIPVLAETELHPGEDFLEGIKERIKHSHIIIPILTPYSSQRPWVNHEIGFALATEVPLLPICIGVEPEGLTESRHGLRFPDSESFEATLKSRLTTGQLDRMLSEGENAQAPIYECAETPDDRNRVLVQHLEQVKKYGTGRLRQMGAFSSFSIPRKAIINREWDEREGSLKRSEDSRRLLREERLLLEEHVRQCGCDLIIKPTVRADRHGEHGTRLRLRLVRDFLQSLSDTNPTVRVAIWPADQKIWGNRTIVGDWFLADAVVPFQGESYRKTIFTRHAPTVLKRIRELDSLMEDLLEEMSLQGRSSREYAIEELERNINALKDANVEEDQNDNAAT